MAAAADIETVQQVAREALAAFTVLRDEAGEPVERDGVQVYVTDKDATTLDIQAMCRDAHGGLFPDDRRYSFIVEALNRITEYDDLDEAADEIEADIYYADRLAWLASHVLRAEYVDEAAREYGSNPTGFDTIEAIGLGQYAERREVFDLVRAWIEERAEDDEEA